MAASLGNIVTVAQQLLDKLGNGAPEIIDVRAAVHVEEGDDETARYWQRVAKAIRYLLSFDPDYLPPCGAPGPIVVPPAVFRQVFAWMPKASLLLQPNLVVIGVNRAFLDASGRPAEELLGGGLFQLFPDNPADAAGRGEKVLQASLMRVLDTGTPDRMARLRYDIRNANGRFEPRWWDTVNAPVFDDAGRISHILHQTRDITAEVGAS